jgi:NAD(P)-dependent dehydrogenase (short-subunit alcohol dehydrogenase family)
MKLFEDDVVVLAGATGRVGRPLVGRLLDEGARVVLISRSAQERTERVLPIIADLANHTDGKRVIDEAVAQFGRIDAVISLAGGGTRFVPVVESTLEDMETSVRNNLIVAYNLFLPALRQVLKQPMREERKSRARFVAVTAGSSLDPQPRFGLMGAGKAGVNTFMRAIAREHKSEGIVSNAVVLGGVATLEAREYLSPEDFAAAASPEEVANILAFHASDASTGVNGELIHLNAREVD